MVEEPEEHPVIEEPASESSGDKNGEREEAEDHAASIFLSVVEWHREWLLVQPTSLSFPSNTMWLHFSNNIEHTKYFY